MAAIDSRIADMTTVDAQNLRTRILLIDEPSIMREGLAALISMQPDMLLVGSDQRNAGALDVFRDCAPDIVIVDVHTPDVRGVDAIGAVRREFPSARIVALSNRDADAPASRALQAGVAAYVLKNAPPQELLEAVRTVCTGRR
jgi:DNA-binding NarL/FixJ family response regulator